MNDIKNGRTIMEEIIANAGVGDGYANLTDDTGELDYEPSEPANSIKDAVSDEEDDNRSIRSSSTPRAVSDSQAPSAANVTHRSDADDDLEEGEVDELEDGEVKEDDEDSDDGAKIPNKRETGGQSLLTMKTKMPPSVGFNSPSPLIAKSSPNNVGTPNTRPEDVGICKFYIRGQCTWGNFCKFLHPGLERGSFQLQSDVQPVKLMNKQISAPPTSPLIKPSTQLRILPPPPQPPPVLTTVKPTSAGGGGGQSAESAWERGLKQAREMMRKANEKKENDVDFEEKRVNMPMDTVEMDRGDEPESPVLPPPSHFERQQSGRHSDGLPEMEPALPLVRRDILPATGTAFIEEFNFGSAPKFPGRDDGFGFGGRPPGPPIIDKEDGFYNRPPINDSFGGFAGGGRTVEPFSGGFGRPPPFGNLDKDDGFGGGFSRPPGGDGSGGFVRPPGGDRKLHHQRPYSERHWSRKQELQQEQPQHNRDRAYSKIDTDDQSMDSRFHKQRDARERIESKKDRGDDNGRRHSEKDSGRPLPYERPSYEGREWRDPWMRSSKMTKGAYGQQAQQDYTQSTTGGGSRRRSALVAERSAKYKRRRRSSYSGSSSTSRSRSSISSRSSASSSSKTGVSKSRSSSSSSRSLSSVGSRSSSRSSQPKRYDKTKFSDKKYDYKEPSIATTLIDKEKTSLKPPTVQPTNRSLSPISKDSNSDTDVEERDKQDSEENQATNKTQTSKESSQRKPIKLTIVNKSRIQVPLAYEEEVHANSRKFEPLSPESSSNDSFDSEGGLNKSSSPPPPPPPHEGMEVEDISSQESEDDEDVPPPPPPQSKKTPSPKPVKETKKEDSKTSRRDELLRQLKAVEDAISKKRRKVD